MLFADDIVLLGESREELNEKLETWRRALETHGFRLSRSKSEYMECKFNKRRRVSNSEVKIGDHIIPQVTRFKYLGSVIQDDGEIEGDVNHRIQAGWMKWRKASGVLCDAKVPIKLKGKFYRTAVRPAILYGTECWAVKSQHENKVGVAEMRMLRWMCGKTRQDKIRNEAIRERVGVAPIVEKMVENRLRWFGHVERRPVDSVVRRVDQMERRQTIRGRGRPKKTIREVIKKDLEINGLDRSMVRDPMPAVYFFLIDVSMNAVQTGATAAACSAITRVIKDKDLPEGPRTLVGVATFDSTIHFYNLKRALQQPLMLIVPDVQDVYTPLQTDVIVPLSECRQHLELLLESIPTMFQNNRTSESAFGAAIKAAFLAMKDTGGKLLVFQSVLPSIGIGALSAREAEGRTNISAGEKEAHKLLQPADKAFKELAVEFAEYQVCVDVFVTTQTYVDIASISAIPRTTGGQRWKDEEGKVLVHEKDIKERWKVYFHNLFNDGYGYDSSSLDTREEDRNYKYYRRIQKQEVKEALKRMSNGKAVGPDNIPIEVWKTLGDRGLEWLTKLFNEIMRSKRMPEEWRRSTLVPIYKNKGDIQNCANYRGIKLMSHTMKLWERVIERRLRKETQVTENQFGFMPGRSTMEAIYLLRRVMEQYRMDQQDLHLIFIDLEKAYDRVPREILWKALEKKGVRVAYIRAIQDMYDRVSTSVRTQGGESDDFPITIGLYQGSTLSPYLFTLILDVLTEQIQEIALRCMLFADDIVLLGESREELNERLETWRRALETHGFRLSRSKSEYMECKFNKSRRVSNSEVKIGDHIIPQVTRFKYLGSVIQDDGEIEGDVNHRIQAGWMKWRKASGVLCDAKVPIKLKGKFYRTAVRPAILYGTECWAVKSQHETKVGVAEMRMLRWMCGKTRQDKIRNGAISERVGVAPIVEKMVENRLRWFGHVERRPVDSVVRRVDQMERRQTIRGRERPKKTIREVIKKDLELNDLDRSMVLDRTLWRKLIHVADPT
ncbi:Protein transport protein Sec24-like CEF [Glycine soja]